MIFSWFKGRQARRRPCTPADLPPSSLTVHLEGEAKEAIETGRNRLVMAGMIFALIFVVLGGRLIQLMVFKSTGEPVVDRTTALLHRLEKPYLPPRAAIVDRNGVLLATSLPVAALYADPRQVMNATVAAARLKKVLPDLHEKALARDLASDRSFVWIDRDLSPRQEYAVNALGIPGLYFQEEARRVYPQGRLAAQVLGYTDVDGHGIAGIEKYFNQRLSDPALRGTPLTLSLDVRVQHAVRNELEKSVTAFAAKGAAGIVLNAHTGEVLAMVSLPDFDPTHAADATPDERFNRATLGVYELGSVFKTFTLAMALNSGKATMTSGQDASHPIHIGGFTIHDDDAKNRWLSIPEIYMYSSNIGAAKTAVDVGATEQRAFLGKLGLLTKSSIELPEVGTPLIPRVWSTIATMTVGFGQGISVSPLQFANAAMAMVNGGLMVPATLLKRPPGSLIPAVRMISPQTSEDIRKLMRLVVEYGTGRQAAAPGYLVGGKTGTAEKVGPHGYRRHANVQSFIAAFPITDPRYVVMVTFDEAHGTKATHGFDTAGWTAAPTAGKIIARIAPMLGVMPVDENSPEIQRELYVALPPGDIPVKDRVAKNRMGRERLAKEKKERKVALN